MIKEVFPSGELRKVAATKRKSYIEEIVPLHAVPDKLEKGWEVFRKNKKTARVRTAKPTSKLLEDRVWYLLYVLGFSHLSGANGATLVYGGSDKLSNQIDVVAIDGETTIAVECKSSDSVKRPRDFQKDVTKFAALKDPLISALQTAFSKPKRHHAMLIWTMNQFLSQNDKDRARENQISLFNETDLEYYERLAAHLGQAARYQFLADVMEGRRISGLEIRTPALKGRWGKFDYYTFSISAAALLKISFVSHRARGSYKDQRGEHAYQRMVSKGRLAKIQEFISDDNIFPTNIILNFNSGSQSRKQALRFDPVAQEGGSQKSVLGWLSIKPTYKYAWIIDGQHRLLAYSGLHSAEDSLLNVLAFDGLPPDLHSKMFVDINSEQKSVKRGLLHELEADLGWDAEAPEVRVAAIVSRAILDLDKDPDSPFFGRILSSESGGSVKRCISISAMHGALCSGTLFIQKRKRDEVVDPGPFLVGVDSARTLARVTYVVSVWFNRIKGLNEDWWDLGAAPEGGGLAMNDSVVACLKVLQSVFDYLQASGIRLNSLEDNELARETLPFAEIIGRFLNAMDTDKRLMYRRHRGVQGQTRRMRQMQAAIHREKLDFEPKGLREDLEAIQKNTNSRAKELTDEIELTIQRIVLERLREEFGPEDSGWWYEGIPPAIRKSAIECVDRDQGKHDRESYFTLIDYRTIVVKNWTLFQDRFAYSKSGNKDEKTKWMVSVNEIRNIVAHPTKCLTINIEEKDVLFLQDISEFLTLEVDA